MESELHLIHYIDSLGIGGAQSMMFELFFGIESCGLPIKQQIWLSQSKSVCGEYVRSYGIKYSHVRTRDLSRFIESFQEPVILIYHKLMSSKTEVYRKAMRHAPVIVVNHTFTKNSHLNKIEHADFIVCVSNYMKKFLRRRLRSERMGVIQNGVDYTKYRDIVTRPSPYKSDVFLTGRINSMNSIKYSERWLRWCCDVKLPKKMVHEYIGNGMYWKKANIFLDKNKNRRNDVVLLGKINEFEEKISVLKSWDVFLYEINRNEGISISILEALASGVPVICSNHYGNKEIIKDGVNGYVFRDKKHAQDILSRLCERPDELAFLKKSTITDFRQHLDIKYVADNYIDTINKVAKKRNMKIPDLKISKPECPIIKEIKTSGNNNKLFSILTAARNVKLFMDDWVKSIFVQKYRPLEVVFVDDNSTDGSFDKILELYPRFCEEDISLKIIHNEKRMHCGSSYAIAWENSSGYYFGILDGDDMLEEGAIEYIVDLYEKFPDVTYIYTQFMKCNAKMKRGKIGFSCRPKKGMSLLDMANEGKHAYSHWRTFSKRFPKLTKIWGRGLRVGIDKYMGYRLEEFGKGMFVNKVCYKYRGLRPGCISKTKNAIDAWKRISTEARLRRKRYNLKPYPIVVYKNT